MTRTHITRTITTAVCCLLVTSMAVAQQDTQERSGRQGQADDRQTQQNDGLPEIPEALRNLDLSDQQTQEIQKAMQQDNEKLEQAWRDFNKQHARAIELEAAWLAAVRDTIPENEQRKFDQQRMQDRELEKNSTGSSHGQAQRRKNRRADQQEEGKDRATSNRQDDRKSRSENSANDDQRSRTDSELAERQKRDHKSAQMDTPDFVVITVTSPERYAHGMNQSGQQQDQCTKACQEYKQELTSVWQQLHQLHAELVQIEADRVQNIEQHLTEEQLTELHQDREQPSRETASTTPRSNNR
ncbi:MAG: hypothetical protein KDA52_09955 [Planctomycetaceae bacterium]|nr:hypothetical protein [Planctomycetaceae bacterium]